MRIYVGHLSPVTTEAALRQAFEAFGQVSSVAIITDKFSGQSRGFGFVEMPDRGQAQNAIAELNNKPLDNSVLVVNEAKPQEDRGRTDSRRGGGGYGGSRRPGGAGRGRDTRRRPY